MVWDEIVDALSEGWDLFVEGLIYLITFQWFGDAGEFFGSMFENLNELSVTGTVLGLLGSGLIFFIETQTEYGSISAFTQHMSPLVGGFWMVATYVGCFVAGYLVGKHFDNT